MIETKEHHSGDLECAGACRLPADRQRPARLRFAAVRAPNVIPQSVCDMDSFYGDRPAKGRSAGRSSCLAGEPDFYQDDHLLAAPT